MPDANPTIRAAKCGGCGRTYCVCPRRRVTLRIAEPGELAALVEAAVAAGEPVKVATAAEALAAIADMDGAA